VPTAPWRRASRERSSPPGGRRWAGRLRRGGTFARQVLAGRRPERPAEIGTDSLAKRRRFTLRRGAAAVGAPRSPGAPAFRRRSDLSTRSHRGPYSPPSRRRRPVPDRRPQHPVAARRTDDRPAHRFAIVNGCTLLSLRARRHRDLLGHEVADTCRLAAMCLIACVVFDGIDGALARRLRVASPFGAQMDSLADMCSFGIAAPVRGARVAGRRGGGRDHRAGLRAGGVVRRDPAGPVQRVAEGRPVLLRRTDHDGGRGARAGHADRAARRRSACRWRRGAAGAGDGVELPVREAGPPAAAAAAGCSCSRWSARWSTTRSPSR
jgi:hypothetical protein